MVNLEWYRTFVAIYENHTLTKAAKSLYTSQPGVSLHLNALEAYVGRKLFERTSRKMIPTEEGKQLYNFVLEPLEKLGRAEQHFKKTSKEQVPSVHIGMCTETFQAILEPEIAQFNFNLVAKFGNHQDLIKDLNNGLLDLVITPRINNRSTLVEYEPFSKETIILVAGSKTKIPEIESALGDKQKAKIEETLKNNTWYSASNEMEHFIRFWFDNFKRRPDFKPNFILPNISSIIRSLSGKEGLAVVPDFLVENELESKQIKVIWKGHVTVDNTLYFATRTDLQFKKEVAVIKSIFKDKMGGKL
ncbi:MAG: LysR family transcriptional regulator [Pseudozobellia sp.]|nr:LysR family transcriptional regulator [Pseudozobellia sp.]MBG48792.1 LysR family transcriptional regulator [Pseudozobellia sp.]|tara:strand:- start:165609 stop:166517 length:909 start_codon:yes stop_codon:yes gene_type:complete